MVARASEFLSFCNLKVHAPKEWKVSLKESGKACWDCLRTQLGVWLTWWASLLTAWEGEDRVGNFHFCIARKWLKSPCQKKKTNKLIVHSLLSISVYYNINIAQFSNDCQLITRLRLLRSVIGLKMSLQFFDKWEAKSKPIATCTRDFSSALSKLQATAGNSDLFITLFAPVVIGRSNYFGIWHFISKCGLGLESSLDAICGLRFLVFYSAPKRFSPGFMVFVSHQKPTFDFLWNDL